MDLIYFIPYLRNIKIFAKYLTTLTDTSDLIYSLDNYFDGDIWSDFETAFGNLNIKQFLYDNEILLPTENSDRDGERYILPDYTEHIVESLIISLYNKLNNWIISVNKKNISNDLLPIDKSAYFLTFNYTNTLERIYDVKSNNILYLHGKAEERQNYKDHPDHYFESETKDTEIIFGHGFNPSLNNAIKSNKKGINAWVQEDAIEKLIPFFKETMKRTDHVIEQHLSFFKNSTLSQFNKIIIIGHSLSKIDMPYFREIINKAINVKEYIITYHEEKNRKNIEKRASIFRGNKVFINSDDDFDFDLLK